MHIIQQVKSSHPPALHSSRLYKSPATTRPYTAKLIRSSSDYLCSSIMAKLLLPALALLAAALLLILVPAPVHGVSN